MVRVRGRAGVRVCVCVCVCVRAHVFVCLRARGVTCIAAGISAAMVLWFMAVAGDQPRRLGAQLNTLLEPSTQTPTRGPAVRSRQTPVPLR